MKNRKPPTSFKGSDLGAVIKAKMDELERNPPPPQTPKEAAEVEELLKQLRGPGFMELSVTRRK